MGKPLGSPPENWPVASGLAEVEPEGAAPTAPPLVAADGLGFVLGAGAVDGAVDVTGFAAGLEVDSAAGADCPQPAASTHRAMPSGSSVRSVFVIGCSSYPS